MKQLFKTKNKPTTTIQLRMELYNEIIFLFLISPVRFLLNL